MLNPNFVTLHMKWPHYCLSTGVVTSPNYPCNYPKKLNRLTTITAQEGMVVELEFTAFNTYSGSDTLTILDNDGTVLSKEINGDCLPPKMWSRTNVVHLRFVTDSGGTRTGWSANWASVAPTGCTSNLTQLMVNVQKEGNCSYFCPLHFQLWKEGNQLTTESLQLPGLWGEVNVRGNGNCTLRPACELSGTKCCDSGELLNVFCSCIA